MTRLQHSADKQGKHFWSPGECHYGDVPKRSGGQGAWNELYAQTSQTILSRTHTHLYLHRCQLLLCTFKPHHLLKKCLHLKQNMPYNSNISDCQKEWPISDLSAKQHDVHEYTEVRKIPSASPRLFKKNPSAWITTLVFPAIKTWMNFMMFVNKVPRDFLRH